MITHINSNIVGINFIIEIKLLNVVCYKIYKRRTTTMITNLTIDNININSLTKTKTNQPIFKIIKKLFYIFFKNGRKPNR